MIKTILPSFHTLSLFKCYMKSYQAGLLKDSPQVVYAKNILFQDVTHDHLMKVISGSLKQKYLVPYKNDSNIATGILFGPHARPIISLPVEPLGKNGRSISIHFLVDTGVPTTYLSEEALKFLFNVQDLATIESTNVNIWGSKLAVNPSPVNWSGINLLGANYLRIANLAFECLYNQDPSNEYCLLRKKL